MTVCKLPSLLHMRAAAIMEVSGVNEEYKTGTDRYKALFSQTNNMILYFDADGTVCEKNDAVCRNLYSGYIQDLHDGQRRLYRPYRS